MVSRRTFIATVLGGPLVALIGIKYKPWQNRGTNPEQNNNITISGTGEKDTNQFRVGSDIYASIISTTTTNVTDAEILLANETSDKTITLYNGNEDQNTERLEKLRSEDYFISVRGDIGEWEVSIKNITSLPSPNEFSSNIPITASGSRKRVIGPVSVGPYPKTNIIFETKSESDTPSKIELTDEKGINRQELLNIPANTIAKKEFLQRMDGRGFIIVESQSDWELTFQKDPEYEKQIKENNGTVRPY